MNEFTENECFRKFEETTHKSTRKRIDIDFKRVSFTYALALLTKIENVWFCSGGLSYAIQEKFTA